MRSSQNFAQLLKEGTDKPNLLDWLLDSVAVISIPAACPLYPLSRGSFSLFPSSSAPALHFILPLTFFFLHSKKLTGGLKNHKKIDIWHILKNSPEE